MPNFQRFELERLLCRWENLVEYDLSESGVLPVTFRELMDGDTALLETLLDTKLNYAQSNGIPELRQRIAALYPGAKEQNVIATVGCAEANFITLQTMLSEGDELALMMPNYMQIWGIARNFKLKTNEFFLSEDAGWSLDEDSLSKAVTPKTKLIAICNPNNPTGHILTDKEMDTVVSAADRVGAWILADEVYAGTERFSDTQTPTFYGRYDKVLAMNSLSKSYGLPGTRIGWAVAPEPIIEELWARHDYTTIGTTMLGNKLAEIALRPEVRKRLMGRARDLVRSGLPVLEEWLASFPGVFEMTPPEASPIAFVKYNLDISSVPLTLKIRDEKSVLVVPGTHFGMDGHLRFRYGLPEEYLKEGLRRIGEVIESLR